MLIVALSETRCRWEMWGKHSQIEREGQVNPKMNAHLVAVVLQARICAALLVDLLGVPGKCEFSICGIGDPSLKPPCSAVGVTSQALSL